MTTEIIIAVVGSQFFPQPDLVRAYIRRQHERFGTNFRIRVGDTPGVDTVTREEAEALGIPLDIIKADWEAYGRSAGMKRNPDIIEPATHVIAFWDGASSGTKNSIDHARRLGKPLKIVYPREDWPDSPAPRPAEVGTLYDVGYGEPGAHEWIEQMMRSDPDLILVDSRWVPWTKYTLFTPNSLRRRCGQRYNPKGYWLGNVNKDNPELGFKLADENQGLTWLVEWLWRGKSAIVMCGCGDRSRCHRVYIVEKVFSLILARVAAWDAQKKAQAQTQAQKITP